MSDVLIVVGPAGAPVKKGDLAAIGFGKAAAEAGGGAYDVLLMGPDAAAGAGSATGIGARTIFTLTHADLETYTAEAYAAGLGAFLKDRSYRLIGAATSSSSKEYFPRVAAALDVPMASDVVAFDGIDGEKASFTRAVFTGNLLAAVELHGPVAIATCRASAFDGPEGASGESPVEAVTVSEGLGHERKKFLTLHQAKSDRPELTEADVVVSIGRGSRGPEEGIPIIEKLADTLGAAVGASRAVVDAGWLPNEYQVGQTGKIVAPKLYIAVGISGAIQHLAGMRNSKTIVAINKDADAPIFEVADYGIQGDLFELVPAIIAELQKS